MNGDKCVACGSEERVSFIADEEVHWVECRDCGKLIS